MQNNPVNPPKPLNFHKTAGQIQQFLEKQALEEEWEQASGCKTHKFGAKASESHMSITIPQCFLRQKNEGAFALRLMSGMFLLFKKNKLSGGSVQIHTCESHHFSLPVARNLPMLTGVIDLMAYFNIQSSIKIEPGGNFSSHVPQSFCTGIQQALEFAQIARLEVLYKCLSLFPFDLLNLINNYVGNDHYKPQSWVVKGLLVWLKPEKTKNGIVHTGRYFCGGEVVKYAHNLNDYYLLFPSAKKRKEALKKLQPCEPYLKETRAARALNITPLFPCLATHKKTIGYDNLFLKEVRNNLNPYQYVTQIKKGPGSEEKEDREIFNYPNPMINLTVGKSQQPRHYTIAGLSWLILKQLVSYPGELLVFTESLSLPLPKKSATYGVLCTEGEFITLQVFCKKLESSNPTVKSFSHRLAIKTEGKRKQLMIEDYLLQIFVDFSIFIISKNLYLYDAQARQFVHYNTLVLAENSAQQNLAMTNEHPDPHGQPIILEIQRKKNFQQPAREEKIKLTETTRQNSPLSSSAAAFHYSNRRRTSQPISSNNNCVML